MYYEVAEQKVTDPAYQDRACYTQPTRDIAGMMGLPCGIVYGVPADSVVEYYFVLVVEDMVVNKVDGLVGNKVRG